MILGLHRLKRVFHAILWLALSLLSAGAFESCTRWPVEEGVLTGDNPRLVRNHGITRGAMTVKVVPPASGEMSFLLIDNPHINLVGLSDRNGAVLCSTGDFKPFRERPVAHRRFILPLPTTDRSDTLRLELDKTGENLSYTVRLLDARSLDADLEKDRMMTGMVVGFFALAILFSMAMLVYNPAAKYVFFCLYVILALIWILNDAGLFFEWLWPGAPAWHQSSRGFFTSLAMVLFVAYLSRNENAMLSRGIRFIMATLVSLVALKFLLSLVAASGFFPESFKYATLRFNAWIFLALMGGIVIYLAWSLRRNREDAFESLAIMSYCLFVVSLSAKELGMAPFQAAGIHRFEAMLFFPFQCLFMALHLYGTERARERKAQERLLDFRIAQQRTLESRVREVEEEERRRVARNIHDEIGSIFAALKYHVLSLRGREGPVLKEDLDRLMGLSEQGISRQYSIIDDLLLEIRSGQSLKEALQRQVDLSLAREDIQTSLVFEADEGRMGDFEKTQVYRIVTELLTNTIKHAKATRVDIELKGGDPLSLTYADDGKGFDPGQADGGRGLSNLRMRVDALNGEMEMHSGHEGTRCMIIIRKGHV